MKLFLTTIFLFLFPIGIMAQQTISGKIIDAISQEPLSYAKIYISQTNGTMSNEYGDFILHAFSDDSLQISHIGYEPIKIRASDLRRKIHMKPMRTTLQEITITTTENILRKASKSLKEAYKKGREEKALYFCRTTQKVKDKQELMEVFLEAKSTISLRELSLIVGRRMNMENTSTSRPTLANTNLHHMLELGPMLRHVPFWSDIEAPMDRKNYQKYYDSTHDVLFDKNGNIIYAVNMKRKRMLGEKQILEGRLFVDAKTFDIVRFEGVTPRMKIFISGKNILNVEYVYGQFCINYNNTGETAKIESINYTLKGNNFSGKSILFNVDGLIPVPNKNQKKIGENFANEIDLVGFDSILWVRSGIIQRTKEEEKILNKNY